MASPHRRYRHLKIVGTVLAAAVVGVLLLRPVLTLLMERNSVHNGPWRSSATTGSAQANPWERAAVAVAGLYALSREEALYFTAFTDSAGEPLRGECRYWLTGPTPPARWWSLTAYGADHFLIPNAADRYAVNGRTLPSAAQDRIEVTLSADAPDAANRPELLPIPAQGEFSLTLRLYNPPPELANQLASVPLPAIHREQCP